MPIKTPPRDWTQIRWSGLDSAVAARWIAVLPLAATEQHGPHLPATTDVLIARAYLDRVRAILPKNSPATFLPIEEIGVSTEHIAFSVTRTLAPEAAIARWIEIGDAVAARGLRKLVIVTSHGGNSAAMAIVAQELRARHAMLAVTTSWSRFGVPEGLFPPDEIRYGIHGGAIETAILLAAFPHQVNTAAITDFPSAAVAIDKEFRWLSTQRPAPFAWAAQDLNPQGVVGDARLATAAKGEALIEHGARAFAELLADVAQFDPARLEAGPAPRAQ